MRPNRKGKRPHPAAQARQVVGAGSAAAFLLFAGYLTVSNATTGTAGASTASTTAATGPGTATAAPVASSTTTAARAAIPGQSAQSTSRGS